MSVVEYKGALTIEGVDLGAGDGEGRLVSADRQTVFESLKRWAGVAQRAVKQGAKAGFGNLSIVEVESGEIAYEVSGPGEFVINTAKVLTRAPRKGKGDADAQDDESDSDF